MLLLDDALMCSNISVPADGVKGKTWGPSTGSSHVKTRPTIITENPNKSWKTTSAPSLEKSPRSLVTAPSVGTVPEGNELRGTELMN